MARDFKIRGALNRKSEVGAKVTLKFKITQKKQHKTYALSNEIIYKKYLQTSCLFLCILFS